MTYPYESAPTKEVGIALWVLERHEWSWEKLAESEFAFIRRSKLAAQASSLIVHDRILHGELMTRELPSFYGEKAEQ
mgnify:CR=1 FL=1|jgi:hypothetical protein